jgi:uroporphyrinogen-III synthase
VAGAETFGAHVYLGEEFEGNRRQRSHYAYREDSDPDRLAGRILEELIQPPKIYVFGKEDRMIDLEDRLPDILPDESLVETIPAIRVVPEDWTETQTQEVRTEIAQKNRVILCIFSSSAVEILKSRFSNGDALKEYLGITDQHLDVRWATTGESTARAIHGLARGEDILISEDGTSAGLELELQSLNNQDTAFVFLVSRNGRKELIQALRSGPGSILEMPVYRSESIPLDSAVVEKIKNSRESCYILAGSPLTLETLQESGLLADPNGIRLLCLGRTTCDLARNLGLHPYAVASSPDYVKFLSEFF